MDEETESHILRDLSNAIWLIGDSIRTSIFCSQYRGFESKQRECQFSTLLMLLLFKQAVIQGHFTRATSESPTFSILNMAV